MTLPKITVVTVCYRAVDTIRDTLRSVIDQNYPNLEYIVIDGGSDDGTQNVIDEFSPHISKFISEPDDGQYAAIFKGFSLASGDIYYWINADDMLIPGALRIVGEIFRKFPEIDWLTSTSNARWDEQGGLHFVKHVLGVNKSRFLRGQNLPRKTRFGAFIQQESTFFRADLFKKSYPALLSKRLAGDFALWCEMLKHSDPYNCPHILGGFRLRSGQRSEDIEKYLDEADEALAELRQHFSWRWWKEPIHSFCRIAGNRHLQFAAEFLNPTASLFVANATPRGERNWIVRKKKDAILSLNQIETLERRV